MKGRVVLTLVCAGAMAIGLTSLASARPASVAAPVAAPVIPAQGLTTAVFDPEQFGSAVAGRHFDRVRPSGAEAVRLMLFWPSVAPQGEDRPAGFDPANPADPAYDWSAFDRQVRLATGKGLAPIALVTGAPLWAQSGNDVAAPTAVVAAEYGRFAAAAARRYSGTFGGLPRVRYWQAWNEPNISTFLKPQLVNKKPVAAVNYRAMVNAFAAAVKAVHRDNLVVAGGLAPFRDSTEEVVAQDPNWGPLSFMREVLCLSPRLKPKCRTRVRFDAWSVHPYTSGSPERHAVRPNDVSLGDLPEVRATLDAARRAGHVVGEKPTRFWVTEFSWDSAPPDPKAVPMQLLTRWVAHAQFVMWRQGVSLLTWFSLTDRNFKESYFQSGLYSERGTPKPIRAAFRFPVVALPGLGGTMVWGRTPYGVQRQVIVERSTGSGWKRLAVLKTDRNGIFRRTFRVPPTGKVRARITATGERSVPFGAAPVPERFFNPFGSTPPLEPRG